jgi:hypothetical protein
MEKARIFANNSRTPMRDTETRTYTTTITETSSNEKSKMEVLYNEHIPARINGEYLTNV